MDSGFIQSGQKATEETAEIGSGCFAGTSLCDLQVKGSEAVGWRNYSRLTGKKDFFHCHLNKRHPRYVAVWKLESEIIKLIEVRYVGTHEGVNYNRID